MPKRTPPVEWYVAESDAEWQRLCALDTPDTTPDLAPAVHRRLSAQRFLGAVAILFCLLAVVWWWRTAQVTLFQAKAEVTATAQQEPGDVAPGRDLLVARHIDHQSTSGRRHQGGREMSELSATIAASPAYVFDAVQTFEVQGDRSVARIVMYTEHGAPAYRQTRFYQRIGPDWRQTPPDAALWGPQHSLDTPTFVYHFRQNDAPVVITVAPQIEALYITLRRNFGLALTPGEKLVIEVSVTQPPGRDPSWLHVPDRLIVPSPAVYWAPAELSDTELLAQSLALPLLAQVLAQADEQYHIGLTWQPLMDGLYLWQVWELDLPLAVWREEIVHWLYVDLPAAPGATVVVPKRYQALCDAHKLWMSSPVQIEIPLLCLEWYWEKLFFTSWRPREPFTRLDQLAVRVDQSDQRENSYPRGQSVALATLIEYTVAAYGRERLPVLVASLGQYERWDTLLPAVFGVSAAEFEEGWQAYLTAHYAISLPLSLHDN
jgi:hypothetical protein